MGKQWGEVGWVQVKESIVCYTKIEKHRIGIGEDPLKNFDMGSSMSHMCTTGSALGSRRGKTLSRGRVVRKTSKKATAAADSGNQLPNLAE